MKKQLISIITLGLSVVFFVLFLTLTDFDSSTPKTGDILTYQPSSASTLKFYWKDTEGNPLKNISNLKEVLQTKKQKLVFAMNGGIYDSNYTPLGLYIENHTQHVALNTNEGEGNFYLKPNGIFYLTDQNEAHVVSTDDFEPSSDIKYATQSGPMLVIDGQINSIFNPDSNSTFIRNGVCILPDGKITFALSKIKMNLYDFAHFFQKQGCQNALYLDGFVSRMYLPEANWEQVEGDFALIIAVVEEN